MIVRRVLDDNGGKIQYTKSKELASHGHIGQFFIRNSLIVVSGKGKVINIDTEK